MAHKAKTDKADITSLSLLLRHLDTAKEDLAKRTASLKEANDLLERHLERSTNNSLNGSYWTAPKKSQ